jgi:acetyl-CoA carboxylase biotin carboxyl carrier protein
MELKDIKELIALMKKNDLSVFKMEKEGFKITLKKENDHSPTIAYQTVETVGVAPLAAAAAVAALPEAVVKPELREIVSPMVGTFYSSPSPEAPAFVEIGQQVTPETVICIIEAMKVMNEIKAETSGTIAEVSVESGKPVQFGQALFKLK